VNGNLTRFILKNGAAPYLIALSSQDLISVSESRVLSACASRLRTIASLAWLHGATFSHLPFLKRIDVKTTDSSHGVRESRNINYC